ncbi:MAG TPA: hypothetical protein VGB48_03890 [Allosphingosinicella sp.]
MGWLFEALIDWLSGGFAARLSEGKPWWVWLFWMLLPLLVLAALVSLVWWSVG